MQASHTCFRSQEMVYDYLWGGLLCPAQARPSEALSFARNQPCTVRYSVISTPVLRYVGKVHVGNGRLGCAQSVWWGTIGVGSRPLRCSSLQFPVSTLATPGLGAEGQCSGEMVFHKSHRYQFCPNP